MGNLPWSVTEEGMKEWFGEIGEVVAVRGCPTFSARTVRNVDATVLQHTEASAVRMKSCTCAIAVRSRRCCCCCEHSTLHLCSTAAQQPHARWSSDIMNAHRVAVQVRIAEDYETGKRKGFGHVEFADPASAQKAMEFNGEELEGRALRIDVSAPRQRAPYCYILLFNYFAVLLACLSCCLLASAACAG